MKKDKQKKISAEIQKMVREWATTKKIVTSTAVYRPKTKEQAIKQAAAIAYGKYRRK